MTDVVYGGVATPPTAVNATAQSKSTRKSMLRRFYDRLVESRLAHARLEMARYIHLAPQDIRKSVGLSGAPGSDAPRA